MNKYLNKIINSDCLEVMKEFPDKSIDLVLCDPPYGIGIANKKIFGGAGLCKNTIHIKSDWDKTTPSQEYFNEIIRVSKNQIIFGGNYFTDKLPQSNCWLVWDKKNDDNKFSDVELIWTSFNGALKVFRYLWKGMLQENMKNKDIRFHPTTKPIELIKELVWKYSNEKDIILDPFLGSGTTVVACKQLNRNYIGIEMDREYCEIAKNRLKQEQLF